MEVVNVVVLLDAREVALVQGASLEVVKPLVVGLEVTALDALLESDDVAVGDGRADDLGRLFAGLLLDGSGEGDGGDDRQQGGEALEVDHFDEWMRGDLG